MLSQTEMREQIKKLGLKKKFKPYQELESGIILLKTRKPSVIIEGRMSGSEIALNDSIFKVWTSAVKKATFYAKEYGLTIRLFDGEAELHVPIPLADEILPRFGAKVSRTMSPAQKIASQRGLNALDLLKKRPAIEVQGLRKVENA